MRASLGVGIAAVTAMVLTCALVAGCEKNPASRNASTTTPGQFDATVPALSGTSTTPASASVSVPPGGVPTANIPQQPVGQPSSTSSSAASSSSSSSSSSTTSSTTTTSTEKKTSLGPVKTVTDSTFSSEVLKSPDPVLVAFQKQQCVDCKSFDPVLGDIAAEKPIKVTTLDADQNKSTPATYGIETPPCPACGTFVSPLLVVFKNGQVVEKIKIKKPDGSLLTKQELATQLQPHLS